MDMSNNVIKLSLAVIASAVVLVFSSCSDGLCDRCGGRLDENEKAEAVISYINKTNQTVVVESNISGREVSELEPGEGLKDIVFTETTLFSWGEFLCQEFLDYLSDDTYLRVYSLNGELLHEWVKSECDDSERNPFDDAFYSYSTKGSGRLCCYYWSFYIK